MKRLAAIGVTLSIAFLVGRVAFGQPVDGSNSTRIRTNFIQAVNIDAGIVNSSQRYCIGNCSSMVQESGGDIYLQAVTTGGYMRCGNTRCDSNVRVSLPIADAGQLYVANESTFAGAVDITSTSSVNSCTLNAGSPSTCTMTVRGSTDCVCTPVGATAAIAAGGVATGLSGTTLTVTGPNAGNWVVKCHCF